MKYLATLALNALFLSTLVMGSAGAQGYAPSGSYQQSCQNIRVRGGQLIANCQTTGGQYTRSSIPVGACSGADIANINGTLQCARPSGYHGGGYRYTGPLPGGSYVNSCQRSHMNGTVLTSHCQMYNGNYVRTQLDVSQCGRADMIVNVNGQLRCGYRPY